MFDRLFRFDPLSRAALSNKISFAALVLRVGLAVIFLYHGWHKIAGEENYYGASWADTLWRERSVPKPESLSFPAVQIAVAWGELLGGGALLLGLLTRLAALGMLIIQIGAIYLVTFSRGFTFRGDVGYEYNVALLTMCLAVLVLGGGALALDRLFTSSGPGTTSVTTQAANPDALAMPHH